MVYITLSIREIKYRRCIDKMSDVRQLGLAKQILKILKEKPRQTPQSLLSKIDVSMSAIRNNLMVLSDLNLVETPTRGLYQITPLGELVLNKLEEQN
jgi:predicted transcriptional regulator